MAARDGVHRSSTPSCALLTLAQMVIAVAPTETRSLDVLNVVSRIPGWWERRLAGLPAEWRGWERALDSPPVAIEEVPSTLLEETAYELGEAYIDALDPATRLQHGRHYTPALLAEELWREVLAVAPEDGYMVDPAAGAGALLIPPLRSFVESARDPA